MNVFRNFKDNFWVSSWTRIHWKSEISMTGLCRQNERLLTGKVSWSKNGTNIWWVNSHPHSFSLVFTAESSKFSLYFVLICKCLLSQVYGPSEQNDWDTASYPGVADAIATARSTNTSESWKFVQHEIHRVARAVTQASAVLSGSLTWHKWNRSACKEHIVSATTGYSPWILQPTIDPLDSLIPDG